MEKQFMIIEKRVSKNPDKFEEVKMETIKTGDVFMYNTPNDLDAKDETLWIAENDALINSDGIWETIVNIWKKVE